MHLKWIQYARYLYTGAWNCSVYICQNGHVHKATWNGCRAKRHHTFTIHNSTVAGCSGGDYASHHFSIRYVEIQQHTWSPECSKLKREFVSLGCIRLRQFLSARWIVICVWKSTAYIFNVSFSQYFNSGRYKSNFLFNFYNNLWDQCFHVFVARHGTSIDN